MHDDSESAKPTVTGGAASQVPLAQAFIKRCRKMVTQRHRVLAGIVGAGVIIALLLAGLADRQYEIAVKRRTAQRETVRLLSENYITLGATDIAPDDAGRVLALSRRLAANNPADAELAALVAVRLERLGDVLRERDDTDGAIAAYRESHVIGRGLVSVAPGNSKGLVDLTVGLVKLAQLGEDSRARYTEAIAVLRRLDAEGKLSAAEQQRIPELEKRLTIVLHELGEELRGKRDLAGATEVERERLALLRTLAQRAPDNSDVQDDLAHSLSRFGDLLRAQQDLAGGIAAYREGLEVFRALAARDPADADAQRSISVILLRLGTTLQVAQELVPALEACREAADISRALVVKNPEQIVLRSDLDLALQRVAAILTAQGDHDGTLAALRESADVRRALADASPATAVRWMALYAAQQQIGDLELRRGDVVVAKFSYREAAATSERAAEVARAADASLPSDTSKATLVQIFGVAAFYAVLAERPDDGLRYADAALALDGSQVWIALNRALAQLVLGRFEEAKKVYLAHKDTAKPDKSTLASDIKADFETLRKLGIAVAAIDRMVMEIGI
jgi:tetratricopeptide (TPR) repeat protein